MTKKSTKAFLYLVISASMGAFILLFIYTGLQTIIKDTAALFLLKFIFVSVFIVINVIKTFWVLVIIWSEHKWKQLQERHPGVKKIYKA